MEKLEYKVLDLLNQECAISDIERDLDIEDDDLADIIICLDNKELIVLKDKKWIIAEKGKDIFDKRDRLLKKLRIDYMYGEIYSRDEYIRRKNGLEDLSQVISVKDDSATDDDIIKKEVEEKQVQQIGEINSEIVIEKKDDNKDEDLSKVDTKKICSKCGVDNKAESNYCRKCGAMLKDNK